MKPSSIEDPAKLNPLDPRSLLALEELYVGAGCQGILDKITIEGGSSEVRDFKVRCMSFYETAVLEVQKRLPISGPFFHKVWFVQPSTALSYEARKRLPSLPVLQDRYKHLLPSVGDVEQEWRMLPSFFTESEKIELQTKSPDAFWGQVSKPKTFDDKLVLPNIATLAKLVLTLPHSNAETERIFSMLSDMKTRKRNRLGPESVNALLLVKSAMATRGETGCPYSVGKIHSSFRHPRLIYRRHKITSEDSCDAREVLRPAFIKYSRGIGEAPTFGRAPTFIIVVGRSWEPTTCPGYRCSGTGKLENGRCICAGILAAAFSFDNASHSQSVARRTGLKRTRQMHRVQKSDAAAIYVVEKVPTLNRN
ncbi:hypothetical protein HPB47_001786 [Ixodes persulcatus]|uniref:Uncharacterized protein n=1 Tax=Ixodes persulcatus TaxID=34615 RepID=A0AC60PNE9_IXOPE|nr:hypothetical protein HPB47_001786 [Ixodes persulcatus]